MATDTKTVPWVIHTTATVIVNNTPTALSQITMQIPEFSGAVTFKSVKLFWSWDDQVTVTGGTFTTKSVGISLGGGASTLYSNPTSMVNSGENVSGQWDVDLTSQFVTQWTSGTSKTLDVSVRLNMTTGTTNTTTNHTVVVYLTYEYDDTQPTQIKWAMIPLNSQTGAAGGTFVTRDTFPALDTFLPEASKTYRQVTWFVQGNALVSASTANDTLAIMADTSTTLLTTVLTCSLATDRFTITAANASSLSTSTTHTFSYTSSTPRRSHQQCFAWVVYEFDATSANNVRNSVIIPSAGRGGILGTASNATTAFTAELDIQEPGTISDVHVAFFLFWGAIATATSINARIGSGGFVTYTDTGVVFAGNNALMIRNDAAYGLSRGTNKLVAEVYATSAGNTGNACGFWIISYTSGKATAGHGAHIKTRVSNVLAHHTASAAAGSFNAISHTPYISQSNYRVVNAGVMAALWTIGTNTISGISVSVERTSSESGGPEYVSVFGDITAHDSEVGVIQAWGSIRNFYRRWAGDSVRSELVSPTATRNWRLAVGAGAALNNTTIASLTHFITYHAITYTITGTIYGAPLGSSVTIQAHRYDTDECIGYGSRSGPGTYSITVFDDTVDYYIQAYTSSTRIGRSRRGAVGSGDFDVILGPRLGSVGTSRVVGVT